MQMFYLPWFSNYSYGSCLWKHCYVFVATSVVFCTTGRSDVRPALKQHQFVSHGHLSRSMLYLTTVCSV